MGLSKAIGMAEARNAQAAIWASESLATAAIEGEKLNLDSVYSSIAQRLGLDGGAPSRERPVEGLLDMMQDATTSWQKPITAERLCGWQNALFPAGFSSIHKVTAGKFREHEGPMQIVGGRIGKEVIYFEAPPSARVPAEMAELISWFNGPSTKMDGLVRAALVHLWFESIHPFEDGNGRVGRALVDLALAQDLESDLRLYSMATELSAQRKSYYEELNAASREGADINRWLDWFCSVFEKACARSADVMQSALAKARFWTEKASTDLNHAQRKVVNRLLDDGPGGFQGGMTTSKYASLTGVSRVTAFRDLAALTEAGILAITGQGKGTKYHINLPGWGQTDEHHHHEDAGDDHHHEQQATAKPAAKSIKRS
jgi:Fic family protein